MNWSYVAGFFDGEGSVARNNGLGFRITIPQTNEEVLKLIRNFVGFGFIIKVKKRESHWKDSWTYYIASKKDVYYFLKQVLPYLIVKRDIALEAINKLEKQLSDIRKRKELYDKRKYEVKVLRSKGWDYRKIGRELKIDWGYARRLVLDLV
ncbi:MAG: LAGLIDADG family homing endonuclease [Patescibacteria group bacterium]